MAYLAALRPFPYAIVQGDGDRPRTLSALVVGRGLSSLVKGSLASRGELEDRQAGLELYLLPDFDSVAESD